MSEINQIVKNIKRSAGDYYIIWPQVTIFQIFARIIQFLIFGLIGRFLIDWVLIESEGISLVNFEILNSIYIDRLIFAVPLALIIGITAFFFEYLGVIYICDTYFSGEKISLKKTLLKIIETAPEFIQSIFLQTSFYLGILLLGGLFSLGSWIILPNIVNFMFVGFFAVSSIIFFAITMMKLTYVNFKIFDRHKTVFGLFDYRLTNSQLKERAIFLFLTALIAFGSVFIGGILVNFVIAGLANLTNSIRTISILSSLVISISIITATIFNIILTGYLTTYRSLVYHLDFSKIYKHVEGQHDYDYESRAVKIWKQFHKLISIAAVLSIVIVSLVQSISIKNNLDQYLGRDFITMAHRGGISFPENTLEAVNESILAGIDMVEVDLQTTKDGEIILYHDENLNKVGSSDIVSRTLFNDINGLKYDSGETIPTLNDLLEISKDKIGLNLEIKIYSEENKSQIIQTILNQLSSYNSNQDLIITSLDYDIVELTENANPGIDTGLIIAASVGDLGQYDTDWLIVNNIFYSANKNLFKQSDKKIALWSFSTDWSGEESFNEGFDGGITDKPNELKKFEDDFADMELPEQIIQSLLWSI